MGAKGPRQETAGQVSVIDGNRVSLEETRRDLTPPGAGGKVLDKLPPCIPANLLPSRQQPLTQFTPLLLPLHKLPFEAAAKALKQRAITTSLALVKLRELEREVDASRAVYEAFLVRARETREQERVDTVNVRVLADAQAPLDRSWPPRRLLLLAAALFLGLTGGLALAYLA